MTDIFTGLIEETGEIINITHSSASCRLDIKADRIFSDLKIGDSVAVNGVCLTAEAVRGNVFSADVMHETMNRTSFSELKCRSLVNLERALPANGRFGGHIVSGHIDGTGVIREFLKDDIAVWIKIGAAPGIMKYIVEKGSAALDGVSLTVAAAADDSFSVSIIPHTARETTLLSKKCGDKINIECDIIGKYIEKFTAGKKHDSEITMSFLAENGFV